MSIPGFAGTILYVDLTSGSIRKEPLDPRLPERFIGGDGINTRLAYDLIPPDVDPLAPENCIIVGAGPFVGTDIPGSAKIMITTKFPLNGAFGTASGGGAFALMLKTAGYDHLVISGRAPRQVYLKIIDDDVELCDASAFWGLDIFETVDALRSQYEPCSVIPIGPAGERLVKLSLTSIDKGGTVGRGGLPAVMGSKNLKAMVVRGTGKVTVANRPALERTVNQIIERIMKWPPRQALLKGGMYGMAVAAQPDEPPSEGQTGAEATPSRGQLIRRMLQIHLRNRRPLACPSCPLAEKERVHVAEGEYAGMTTYMTHFSPRLFGSTDPLVEYNRNVKFIDNLNRLGIDFSTFPALVSFVAGLYEQGVIDEAETGSLVLRDDFDTAMKLLHLTAYREGLGDLLAEGISATAQRLAPSLAHQVAHVKEYGIVYDPRLRGLGTMEFSEVVNFRGSHVAAGGSPSYDPGRSREDFLRHAERMGASPEMIQRVVGPEGFNPGRYTRISENWFSLFNSLSLCNRAFLNRFWHVKTLASLYTAVTGRETAPAALMASAERVWTLGKLLNVRAGFTRADDKPPEAWFTPLKVDGVEYPLTDYYRTKQLTREDFAHFLDEYYDERGWDIAKGIPTEEALARAGLSDLNVGTF